MNKISFSGDVATFSQNKKIIIDGAVLELQVFNENTTKSLLQWKAVFEMMGQKDKFMSNDVLKVAYCFLSDCGIVKSENDKPTKKYDLYDTELMEFLSFKTVNITKRVLKLKAVINKIIIIDCIEFPTYHMYELYNVEFIKKYYGKTKIDFDIIKDDISLIPTFTGNINDLLNDYKKLSINMISPCNMNNVLLIKHYLDVNKKLRDELYTCINKCINKCVTNIH